MESPPEGCDRLCPPGEPLVGDVDEDGRNRRARQCGHCAVRAGHGDDETIVSPSLSPEYMVGREVLAGFAQEETPVVLVDHGVEATHEDLASGLVLERKDGKNVLVRVSCPGHGTSIANDFQKGNAGIGEKGISVLFCRVDV